jgi:acyl-coenzyme A thioesterase PaaI-like protein
MRKNKIINLVESSWKMKLYMLTNLPMGFIAGLKITEITTENAQISVPYNFINKNPFKSMYFAVQAMAAELSSGILALSEVSNAKEPVSMLVLNMKASFIKKARSKVVFTCNYGKEIKKAIENSISSREGQTVDVVSVGLDNEGDKVAEFTFTWTFKPKIH